MIIFYRPREQRRKTEAVTWKSKKESFEFYSNAGIERNLFGTTDWNSEYQHVEEYLNEFPKGKRTVILKYSWIWNFFTGNWSMTCFVGMKKLISLVYQLPRRRNIVINWCRRWRLVISELRRLVLKIYQPFRGVYPVLRKNARNREKSVKRRVSNSLDRYKS